MKKTFDHNSPHTTNAPAVMPTPADTSKNKDHEADAAMPSTYKELPSLNKTWPKAFDSNGELGWSTPLEWIKAYGIKCGVDSTNALRDQRDKGSLTTVTQDMLSKILAERIMVSESTAKKTSYMPVDPAVRPDPGPLNAVLWISRDGNAKGIPTQVSVGLYDLDRSAAYQALATQAALVASQSAKAVRVAWMTRDGLERIVEYIDTTNASIREPNKNEDLESTKEIAAVKKFTHADQQAHLLSAYQNHRLQRTEGEKQNVKPLAQPVPAIPEITGNSFVQKTRPETPRGSWVSNLADSTPSNRQNREITFAASRKFADILPTTPTASSHHIVYISSKPKEFWKKFGVDDGIARIHAGIVSNFATMLASGTTPHGSMDSSSRILVAWLDASQKNNKVFSIVGQAPYAGLEPNGVAASIIVNKGNLVKVDNPITLSMNDLDMAAPNLPFVISRHANTAFNIPGPARERIWLAVHTAMGWPTE